MAAKFSILVALLASALHVPLAYGQEKPKIFLGATFGTASLTGGTITALREALKLKGLEYPRDYKLLVIAGGSSANLAALQSGQIAATTVAVPLNFAAEESGLNVIGRLSEGIA